MAEDDNTQCEFVGCKNPRQGGEGEFAGWCSGCERQLTTLRRLDQVNEMVAGIGLDQNDMAAWVMSWLRQRAKKDAPLGLYEATATAVYALLGAEVRDEIREAEQAQAKRIADIGRGVRMRTPPNDDNAPLIREVARIVDVAWRRTRRYLLPRRAELLAEMLADRFQRPVDPATLEAVFAQSEERYRVLKAAIAVGVLNDGTRDEPERAESEKLVRQLQMADTSDSEGREWAKGLRQKLKKLERARKERLKRTRDNNRRNVEQALKN